MLQGSVSWLPVQCFSSAYNAGLFAQQVKQIKYPLKCRKRAQSSSTWSVLCTSPHHSTAAQEGDSWTPKAGRAPFANYHLTQKYFLPSSGLLCYSLFLAFIHLFIHSANIYWVPTTTAWHVIMLTQHRGRGPAACHSGLFGSLRDITSFIAVKCLMSEHDTILPVNMFTVSQPLSKKIHESINKYNLNIFVLGNQPLRTWNNTNVLLLANT